MTVPISAMIEQQRQIAHIDPTRDITTTPVALGGTMPVGGGGPLAGIILGGLLTAGGAYLGGSGAGPALLTGGQSALAQYQQQGQFADPPGTGPVAGVMVGGPGVPEPPANMVVREWRTTVYSNTFGYMHCYFFALSDGRIMMWHSKRNYWKVWRPKKNIVLPRGRTTLSQAVKAQRYLDKMWRTVAKRTKALKMA